MARTLYTKLLWAQPGSTSGSGLVIGPVVPTGYVWVVRDVVAIAPGLYSDSAGAFLLSDGDGVPIFYADSLFSRGQSSYHWDGHQLVPEANWLQKSSDLAGWSWRVTGYQLTLP